MILDHLTPERILLSGSARDKRGVLAELAQLLAIATPVAAADVLTQLVEREQVMSTGIGHGVAIPHARMAACAGMTLALVRYPKGIDFRALDNRPVHLAFGVIGPPQGSGQHVKLLARIARLVKEPAALDEIVSAPTVEALVEVLTRRDS